jgi:hypothetical protein
MAVLRDLLGRRLTHVWHGEHTGEGFVAGDRLPRLNC